MGSVVVPAVLAVGLIAARAVASEHRMPYPYELTSAGVIYGLAGLLTQAAPELGVVVAWGYLIAMIVRPQTSTFLVHAGTQIQSTAPAY